MTIAAEAINISMPIGMNIAEGSAVGTFAFLFRLAAGLPCPASPWFDLHAAQPTR